MHQNANHHHSQNANIGLPYLTTKFFACSEGTRCMATIHIFRTGLTVWVSKLALKRANTSKTFLIIAQSLNKYRLLMKKNTLINKQARYWQQTKAGMIASRGEWVISNNSNQWAVTVPWKTRLPSLPPFQAMQTTGNILYKISKAIWTPSQPAQ